MKVSNGKVLVEAYDQHGKVIGTVPNEKTSSAFRSELERAFSQAVSPDPDGVIAIISNPMIVRE
jgi:hypothetical protein